MSQLQEQVQIGSRVVPFRPVLKDNESKFKDHAGFFVERGEIICDVKNIFGGHGRHVKFHDYNAECSVGSLFFFQGGRGTSSVFLKSL